MCSASSKTISRTASKTTLTTTNCSTKNCWQKLFHNNVFDNNPGREDWRNNIEKNIDNNKYTVEVVTNNNNNKIEKNKFIKNNYGNNIEKNWMQRPLWQQQQLGSVHQQARALHRQLFQQDGVQHHRLWWSSTGSEQRAQPGHLEKQFQPPPCWPTSKENNRHIENNNLIDDNFGYNSYFQSTGQHQPGTTQTTVLQTQLRQQVLQTQLRQLFCRHNSDNSSADATQIQQSRIRIGNRQQRGSNNN